IIVKMPDIKLNNIIVNFPFEPYEVQKVYMSKVIECLQNKKHGVLESPTARKAHLQAQSLVGAIDSPDFGGDFFKRLKKDLQMASSGGGAAEANPEAPSQSPASFGWSQPKIIYASRTHSQLTQVMGELKRTNFKHLKVAVIGSRDQLCIHPEISKESNSADKIHLCQSKVRTRSCMYYNNVETKKEEAVFKDTICDIEDLVKNGTKHKCCPYFMAKELKQSADITFMPYNYLLDPKTRRSQGIDLQNHVILLDEAHNVEKTCEESASLQISSTDIALCIDEVTSVMKRLLEEDLEVGGGFEVEKEAKDFTPDDLCTLKSIFLGLEAAVDQLEIKDEKGDTYPGSFIFELLESAQLVGNHLQVAEKLDKVVLWLATTSTSPFARTGRALQKFADFVRTVFTSSLPPDSWTSTKVNSSGKLISYWCFSPGFGMRQLLELGAHSIILTSGTLSPLKPFITELGIPIEIVLENPHIIPSKQISIGVLSNGPDGQVLNSSFNTRNDPKYISSLGRTILNFSNLIPDGLLVFFPSYPIMKKCVEDWQQAGLWSSLVSKKPVFIEPQGKDTFNAVISEFYGKIKAPESRGAIFLAVCRGKVSEGLDFSDDYGRAVLVTGLPYPPMMDPRVLLKQRYLDEIRKKNKEGLTGGQWYQLEASRAVNQAVGRIIRHIGDYGAIILCDTRFNSPQFKEHLSKWLKPHLKNYQNFGIVTRELRDFFKNVGECKRNFRELPTVGKKVAKLTANLGGEKVKEEKVDFGAYKMEAKKVEGSVNFVTSKVQGQWSARTWESTKEEGEGVVKKRKIKIQKLEVNYKDDKTVCEEETAGKEDDKKLVGQKYLKSVKKGLSKENFKVFAKMIESYRAEGDFNELIKTLEMLFMEGMKELIVGFRTFLKKQHVEEFEEFCRRKGM
ncbi:Similar to AAEL008960: Regulator of telomere elongation helicase 1 homolog (Aedes aegypti), partial [Cotesia congregata]